MLMENVIQGADIAIAGLVHPDKQPDDNDGYEQTRAENHALEEARQEAANQVPIDPNTSSPPANAA